ncbi:FUSC family protein [Nonomuraea pusilla]|uniref:Fusaric acid resistance protein-like n=1 Tax=Nonomuraea pusilla TaxID=46177 RepID=A0A1H7SP54_9ACTN|nr:FUSC family protein [Nonomuraea pusilla]SEL73544.1 Fusaric acid resistance protein-like [Nonomuraea pusilla]
MWLPVRRALRLAPLGDIWHKPALSAVAALAVVQLTLLAADRLDLVLYASAGAMCALYGHALPYAARARALAWVVLGMLSSTAIALVTAALTDSVAIRVAVAAALAGLHKAACDATRIGPPGNVVLTFMAAAAAFAPQRLGDVPLHVGIGVAGGALAWMVGMAPALVRPSGPARIAAGRALEAAARLPRARAGDRHALRRPRQAAVAGQDEAGPGRTTFRRVLLDVAGDWRTVAMVTGGTALAGWASMALGVGRPYWAVVTAAAVFAAGTTASWNRAFQRVVGNLLGVALFTLLAPLTGLGPLALVVTVLALQFVTEAAMTRNYWLGTVFVTPMAILMTEFAGRQPVATLVADRWLDTCLGVAAGLPACLLLLHRRAAHRRGRTARTRGRAALARLSTLPMLPMLPVLRTLPARSAPAGSARQAGGGRDQAAVDDQVVPVDVGRLI